MKRKIYLTVIAIITLLSLFSFTACNKPKTFEDACEMLKEEITSNTSYLCDFEHTEVYGRPVYMITCHVTSSYFDSEYADRFAKLEYNKFKDRVLPFIEENFANFENESIILIMSLNGKLNKEGSGYLYGYYAK